MVIYEERFKDELKNIYDFIARDNIQKAKQFVDELIEKLEDIEDMPFKCRKSYKFDDENIRDMIFKSYVVPYFIDDNNIYILGIYKNNEWIR